MVRSLISGSAFNTAKFKSLLKTGEEKKCSLSRRKTKSSNQLINQQNSEEQNLTSAGPQTGHDNMNAQPVGGNAQNAGKKVTSQIVAADPIKEQTT